MNKSITTKNILKQLGKRWFLCVVFGFDLVVLVALSEAMRSMLLGLTPDSSNLNNWITVFLWVLVLVPAILLPLWYLNPYAIKKLLVTFGLSEEPPIVEKQPQKAESQDEKKTTVAKQAITFPSKWTLRVLVMVTLLAVIFVLSYWFSKGNDLARMFLPTFIGLAITFIFFVAFFDLREELEWKRIKEEVYYMIGLELGTIFYEILNYVENGFVTSSYLMSLNKQETRRKAFLSALIELKDAKELKLNDAEWKLMMEKRTPLDGFSVAAKGLNDVEVKYSKFLSPQ